jgi:hypothetical protein
MPALESTLQALKGKKLRPVATAEADNGSRLLCFVPSGAEEANIFQELTAREHRNSRWYMFGSVELQLRKV